MNPASIQAPPLRDVVLLGGGHSHVQVLKRLGMQREPGIRLTLIARELDTPYSGMLPGTVEGQYAQRMSSTSALPRLARFAHARLIHGEAIGVDPEAAGRHARGPATTALRRALHQHWRDTREEAATPVLQSNPSVVFCPSGARSRPR